MEFLECPQYLRKALFPVQRPLKFAGILNPLDGMHHLRATDLKVPFREGVVQDKILKSGQGSYCDIGLDKVSNPFAAPSFAFRFCNSRTARFSRPRRG